MTLREAAATENRAVVNAPGEGASLRRLWHIWTAVIALGFIAYLFHGYDSDELQHLHIAWRIGQGELPYRDFFEHHPPLFPAILAPIFRSFTEADFATLLLSRGIALGISLLCIRMLYLLLRRFTSPMAACLGVGAMISLPVFGRSAMELRPDVPGLLSILGATLILAQNMQPGKMTGARQAFFAGTLFGTAFCFTQKALIPLIGVCFWMAALCLFASAKSEERRHRIAAALAFLSGAALVVGICALLFVAQGAGREFWEYVIAINLRWKRIAPGWHCMPETLLLCFPLFVFALTTLLRMLEQGRALLREAAPESLLGALLISGIVGQFTTPIPTWQSVFVFLVPWTVCLSAMQMARLASEQGSLRADRFRLLAASAMVLSAMTWVNTAIGVIAWNVIALIGWRFWRRAGSVQARIRCLMAMALTPGLIYRFGFSADQFYRREYIGQQRMVRYLTAYTAPQEPVLHLWPVLLPFRPAATQHWFATLDTLNSLADIQMEAEYIVALESGKARLIAVNPRHMERFLPGFARYLETHCRQLSDAPSTRDRLIVYECQSSLPPSPGRVSLISGIEPGIQSGAWNHGSIATY